LSAAKSENPAATGLNADKSTDTDNSNTAAFLIAAMAMRGHTVQRLEDGAFLIHRWGLTKHCWSLAELEAFARQVGATHV
jgi:hypothetical protein